MDDKQRKLMEAQRAARLAYEVEHPNERKGTWGTPPKAKAVRKVRRSGTRQDIPAFQRELFSQIDDSAGPDACHPWKGDITPWLRDAEHERPPEPRVHDRHGTHRFVRRVKVAEHFNLDNGVLDDRVRTRPSCDNHLCCNTAHILVHPHRPEGEREEVTAEEYCSNIEYFTQLWFPEVTS